jgi:hypothetical protein
MAAAGQIQLAVVSAAAGDRDSAYGTVISVAPSHCQSAFVLQVARDLAGVRITLRVVAGIDGGVERMAWGLRRAVVT